MNWISRLRIEIAARWFCLRIHLRQFMDRLLRRVQNHRPAVLWGSTKVTSTQITRTEN